ncbi:hypothetical protein [Streptomyces glaucescens]|uniref:Uncharacterized protein n=1 Tax=Streptomyces glaucescens TaxID=1907 RepID=A0A089X3S5_STRGA|nr:hypothetical protein [Streptomyces glaucescens]AIR97808.1 hypothetical protein SGLAU_08980 [Streptomyces glaucescens]
MTTQDRSRDGRPQRLRPARTQVSVAGLRARGWTAALVRQLLGEPDVLRPHPLFRTARQIGLYRLERVEAAERGEEFRAVAAAAARRSAAARTAALRRRRIPRRPGPAGLGDDDAHRRAGGPGRIRMRARCGTPDDRPRSRRTSRQIQERP